MEQIKSADLPQIPILKLMLLYVSFIYMVVTSSYIVWFAGRYMVGIFTRKMNTGEKIKV